MLVLPIDLQFSMIRRLVDTRHEEVEQAKRDVILQLCAHVRSWAKPEQSRNPFFKGMPPEVLELMLIGMLERAEYANWKLYRESIPEGTILPTAEVYVQERYAHILSHNGECPCCIDLLKKKKKTKKQKTKITKDPQH